MIRTLLLTGAAIAAYALTQSHSLLPCSACWPCFRSGLSAKLAASITRFLPRCRMNRSITTTSNRMKNGVKRSRYR